jgi:hypothetical protein
VGPCGAFDVLDMLQQNKGCSSLCGPVAQLGARFHGMEEVIGSIPIRSTKTTPFEINILIPELPPPGSLGCKSGWNFKYLKMGTAPKGL